MAAMACEARHSSLICSCHRAFAKFCQTREGETCHVGLQHLLLVFKFRCHCAVSTTIMLMLDWTLVRKRIKIDNTSRHSCIRMLLIPKAFTNDVALPAVRSWEEGGWAGLMDAGYYQSLLVAGLTSSAQITNIRQRWCRWFGWLSIRGKDESSV